MYPQSSLSSDAMQNIPSQALMFTMYSTTFGNYSFVVQPPVPGQSSDQWPTVPYLSIEALLYQGQMSNPQVQPSNIQTGNTTGVQNLTGAQTQQDATGTARSLSGFQQTTQLLQG